VITEKTTALTEYVDLTVQKLKQFVETELEKEEKNVMNEQVTEFEISVQKNVKKLQFLNVETVKKNSEKNVTIDTEID
jgi:hypothetical protein